MFILAIHAVVMLSTVASLVLSNAGMLRNAGFSFVTALAITLVATPFVRRFAVARELYDRPDTGLKPHQRPVPYLGGVAMYLGWFGAMLAVLFLPHEIRVLTVSVLIAGTVLMLTGLIDDLKDLRPRTKLALQALAAAILVFGGVGRTLALLALNPLEAWLPGVTVSEPVLFGLSGMLVGAILLGSTNATNLIDGLDGLCAGLLGIAGLGYLVISLAVFGEADAALPIALAGALVGICLGFLAYNFNPASIFMGDSGSLLLGFNAAVLMILIGEVHSPARFAGAVMVFAFPI